MKMKSMMLLLFVPALPIRHLAPLPAAATEKAVTNKTIIAANEWDAPAVRRPTGLVADVGNAKAYLEWNPGLEENLAGYRVYRKDGDQAPFKRVTPKLLTTPEFVDSGLKNGQPIRYHVTAVLKAGLESGPSNEAEVTPREMKSPEVSVGRVEVRVPGYDPVKVDKAITVTFENGHKLVFDSTIAKVRDWLSDDGTHLMYPLPYGNPIDITEMDEFGFPVAQPATADQPAIPPRINLNYASTMAKPGAGPADKNMVWFVGYQVSDSRITFEYRVPLAGPGVPITSTSDLWVTATLWETYTPVERKIDGGATYKGLARKIDIEMPSYYREGYSICPNDGFGPNGSADKGKSLELRWENERNNDFSLVETHWVKGIENHGEGQPRSTWGFHPTPTAVQVEPFLMTHFPQGTLILAPRRYYYSTTYSLTNYAAQGRDGLWPNYTVDMDASGKRTPVETFEYLWTTDKSLPMPQKFIDATFYYRRNLADLYGLGRNVTTMDYAWDIWGPGAEAIKDKSSEQSLEVLRNWGTEIGNRSAALGADIVGGAHEMWTSSPYLVSDDIRLNPHHPINRAIADMIANTNKQGVRWGYWVRPEFIKQALPNVLSTSFSTQYYGYVRQLFPPGAPIVEKRGLELVREHPEWLRLGKNGSHPEDVPYNWTPVSLTRPGWYEELVYKDLVMMKKLGFSSVYQDGGFANLSGVDYSTGRARANMPYFWRFYEDIAQLGMDVSGESLLGWGNSTLAQPSRDNMKELWAFTHTVYRGNIQSSFPWYTAEMRYRSHQLYIGSYMNLNSTPDHAAVARFAQKFIKQNGQPDRVFLEGLRWEESRDNWVWDKVWWEYKDGRRVQYPNYADAQLQ